MQSQYRALHYSASRSKNLLYVYRPFEASNVVRPTDYRLIQAVLFV